MEKEVNSLKELNTWTLVDLPIKRKALKGRWVYKTKLNKDRSIDKGYNDYILYTDSQSAIELAKNPEHHARTKHIDIQYHFVRENTQNGLINLKYISTNQQLADGLTKALDPTKFNYYTTSIGLKDLVNSKN